MSVPSPWRVVRSLITMGDQLNSLWPARSKASDGTIADAAHDATSDHYPHKVAALGPGYVVTARDVTHDPEGGVDCGRIAENLRLSADPRIKYVIFSRRIYSNPAYSHASEHWAWRDYDGSDPHTNHMHVSVRDIVIADSTTPWMLTTGTPSTGGGTVATLDRNDIFNVASAVIQWADASGALSADYAGAEFNLMTVAKTLYGKLDALSVAPVEFTAEDVATEILKNPAFLRVLTEATEAAIARVRIVVDPAITG